MIHSPTSLLLPRDEKAERRLWALLSALFVLVAGVNVILAVAESAWWQVALGAGFLIAGAGCARAAAIIRR